jgi:hypothetical protein
MKEITEIINVKVNLTEKEMREAIFGGSVMPYVRISERYSNARKLYEDKGYKIVSEDIDKFKFTAEKKFLSNDSE